MKITKETNMNIKQTESLNGIKTRIMSIEGDLGLIVKELIEEKEGKKIQDEINAIKGLIGTLIVTQNHIINITRKSKQRNCRYQLEGIEGTCYYEYAHSSQHKTNQMNITKETILDLTPCTEARDWLAGNLDAESAWANCHRGDWLWWVLRKLDLCSKELSVAFARNCAERAKEYADDDRAAAYAADAQTADTEADAFYAADVAAEIAVYAISRAAGATDAARTTSYATRAARAADVAGGVERQRQADWLRANFNPFE